jgi:hypothetical protein
VQYAVHSCEHGTRGTAFDFVDLEDAQIRSPAVEAKQRVIVRGQVF